MLLWQILFEVCGLGSTLPTFQKEMGWVRHLVPNAENPVLDNVLTFMIIGQVGGTLHRCMLFAAFLKNSFLTFPTD